MAGGEVEEDMQVLLTRDRATIQWRSFGNGRTLQQPSIRRGHEQLLLQTSRSSYSLTVAQVSILKIKPNKQPQLQPRAPNVDVISVIELGNSSLTERYGSSTSTKQPLYSCLSSRLLSTPYPDSITKDNTQNHPPFQPCPPTPPTRPAPHPCSTAFAPLLPPDVTPTNPIPARRLRCRRRQGMAHFHPSNHPMQFFLRSPSTVYLIISNQSTDPHPLTTTFPPILAKPQRCPLHTR